MADKHHKAVVLVLLLPLLLPVLGKKGPTKKSILQNPGSTTESVWERGLVAERTDYKSILKEHNQHWDKTTERSFSKHTLAYVTPWNGKGYDIARTFRSKFTHVSPVWYQVRLESQAEPLLTGGHDVDQAWISSVRKGATPKIVPRFVLEIAPPERLVNSAQLTAKVIEAVVGECRKQGFDGAVLEAWSAWMGNVLANPQLRQKALKFVSDLGDALHAATGVNSTAKMHLGFVIPPSSGQQIPYDFSSKDLGDLASHVDFFSLMTYDYVNRARVTPSPNAPLSWVSECLTYLLGPLSDTKQGPNILKPDKAVQRELKSAEKENLASKVLVGLNFYGYDYNLQTGGLSAAVGHEYIKRLDDYHPKVAWEGDVAEHSFEYTANPDGSQHKVYYPSLQSIQKRLEEVQRWGAGLAIWEIGQGLDYFYDLL